MSKPGWGKVNDIAKHVGCSSRTVRKWLAAGLPHSRLPSGTILIKYERSDEYLEGFCVEDQKVDRIVDDVLRGM